MNLLKALNAGVAFALELAMLAALGYWGYWFGGALWLKWLLAIALPVLAAGGWGLFFAPRAPRRLPLLIFWLEDVVSHDDYAGLARVATALMTPIAAGEYHYGIVPFRHLLEARAIDIVMIDVLRVGGITQWLKVAGMAEAFNLPVVSHLLPEIHVHLIAGIPNGLTIEYMPWTIGLFEETPAIEDGQLIVPKRPGLGLSFDAAAIKRYQIAETSL